MRNPLLLTLLTISAFAQDIFIDTKNNLIWQDNKDTITIQKPFISKQNFLKKDYKNTSGDTAFNYCDKLELNKFTDWRLPTIEELKKLNQIQDKLTFNKKGSYYWSSTYNLKDSIANRSVMVGHSMSIKSPLWNRSLIVGDFSNVRCVRDVK